MVAAYRQGTNALVTATLGEGRPGQPEGKEGTP